MKQVLVEKGKVTVADVPTPLIGEGEVLVQVHCSCISTGTEISTIKSSATPLYKKVLRKPQNIKKALEMIRSQGLIGAITRIKIKINESSPLGYSASGVVLDVGEKIKNIKPGDRVACAGAGVANHAEFIAVPQNLLVKIPGNLSFEAASTITLGSIALQGVRRADSRLGESIAVVGLGILGQLTVQILKTSGCKVVGIDPDQKRINIAISSGVDKCLNPNEDDVVNEVTRFSDGHGVDSVIITASTEDSDVLNQAMEMCRKKGKVVIVGAVGLNLKRDEFYKKELDVLISTSYGPGRYDEEYERRGLDYPYAYVRWTENRNMKEYLQMLEGGKVDVNPLIAKVYSIEDAPAAFEELKTASDKPLLVILKYNEEATFERKIVISESKPTKDKINVALIGAGGFATGVLMPNIQKLGNLYGIHAIASRTGSDAKAAAKQFGASYATTDFEEVLKDNAIDLVVIATRHNLHAQLAIKAARAGKAIFMEKPMAMNAKELEELVVALEETKVPFMIGFNRRFSCYAQKIKEVLKSRANPMIINYQMNAGYIGREHWVNTEEGGGRNIGEACHIYDLFNFFTDSEVEDVSTTSFVPKTEQYAGNDNFVTTIKYKDGSICNLVYTALGTNEVPKEKMEIYVDGKIIQLEDYKMLKFFGTKVNGIRTKTQDKGHFEELCEFAKSINDGGGYPIPLWQLIQATEISFKVEEGM